jgi:hypothetical protein
MSAAGCARGHPLFIEITALIFATLHVNFAENALGTDPSF